jgi:RNA polymerase sigma-70 factor (ECF subfamily)
LERIQKGADAEGWSDFLALYTPLIGKWLWQRGVHRQDADDICQEVLAVVVAELPSFDHNGRVGAFRNWLRTITAHRLRTFRRRQKRAAIAGGGPEYADLAAQLEDPQSELSQLWNLEHDRHVVGVLLQKIEAEFQEKHREAFRRVLLEGQTAAQAAAELETTVSAVRVAQSRILTRLRELGAGLID